MITQDWILGFMWACGYEYRNPYVNYRQFRIQNQDIDTLSEIASCLGLSVSKHQNGTIIISISHNHPVFKRIMDLKWIGRNNTKERTYPVGDINNLEFIRGYCKTKASIGYKKRTHSERLYLRLRIEGAYQVLEKIDSHICAWINSKPKKIQTQINKAKPERHQGKDGYHHILYYQSQQEISTLSKLLNIPLPEEGILSKRRKRTT